MRAAIFCQQVASLPGFVIGLMVFSLVIPLSIIDPANIGWLGIHEDTRTYFLGWDFYRKSPWQFPISANPDYGMEIAGSIFMADTIPFLAIPLKMFHGVLPVIFQYHGIWLLACFALQGFFGWKLAAYITSAMWLRACITLLFLFQLPFLSRALSHLPLMAHFLILAGLLLCLRRYPNFRFYWLFVIICAACINAYLLLMVLGLWFSDCLRRNIKESIQWKGLLSEIGLLVAVSLFFCWQVGYFSVGGGVSAAGNPYGLYRFNLLSPIDPNSWSRLIKDIPGDPGDGEGFAYLGLGFIFLVLAAVFSLILDKSRSYEFPGNRYLVFILLFFAFYSVTNNIGFGPYSLVVPLPEFLSKFTSVFRASGRLIWPLIYFVLIFVCALVCRKYTKRAATIIFGLAVALQIADTSAGWMPQKAQVAGAQASSWRLGLDDPFWNEAGTRYQAVRRLPAGNVTTDWSVFGAFAGSHSLKTDSVYLARVNYDQLSELNKINKDRIENGEYDPDTLYIVSNQVLPSVLRSLKSDQDLLALVDGYIVIAPRWKSNGLKPVNELTHANFLTPVVRGSSYEMTSLKAEGVRSLTDGWDIEVGNGGVWSSGARSSLQFPVKTMDFDAIEVTGTPLVSPVRPVLTVRISINGESERSLGLDGSRPSFSLDLTPSEKAAIARDARLVIKFSYDNPTTPRALGINGDERVISFAIRRVKFV